MTYPENEALVQWLERETPEAVLEPELPIIDPHHHLWDIRNADIEPLASFRQKVYLCEEIMNDIQNAGHNSVQTVFAQCGAFTGRTAAKQCDAWVKRSSCMGSGP